MKRRLKRTGIIIGALILVIAVIFFVVDRQVSPLLMNVASAEVKEKISQLANECVLGVMSRSSEYSDLVTLTTDDNGHVTYLSADSIRMNGIAYNASLAIQEELEKADEHDISIPLGSVLGSDLFSGAGPMVNVRIQPAGNVSTQYKSEFAAAGINQTRHKIVLVINTEVIIILPTASASVTVSTQITVSETIIVGTVPNNYVNVDETDKMLNLIPDGD